MSGTAPIELAHLLLELKIHFHYSSFEAASPLSEAIPIQSDVADHSAIVDDDSSPEKYSSNFDRKISVSEAEQNNLDLDKEHKSGDSSYDKPRTERNSLPRDASAEALASELLYFVFFFMNECLLYSLMKIPLISQAHFCRSVPFRPNYGVPHYHYSIVVCYACHIFRYPTWIY